jgi:hypothetical protein
VKNFTRASIVELGEAIATLDVQIFEQISQLKCLARAMPRFQAQIAVKNQSRSHFRCLSLRLASASA